MSKPKPKPPIDRENAVDVPPVDQPFPSIEFSKHLFVPQPGFSVKEAVQIQMAFMFKVLSVPVQPSMFDNLVLTDDYVGSLPENTRRHFQRLSDE